jgi:signal transduction histidine kinase
MEHHRLAPVASAAEGEATLPVAAAERVLEARRAMLMGAAGVASYLGVAFATRDLLGLQLSSATPLFLAVIALNLALAAAAPRWVLRRWAAVVYGSFHGIMMTVLLGLMGGAHLGILFSVYAFPIFHSAMLRTGASVFVTANVCAIAYAILVWTAHDWRPPVLASALYGFPLLNFLALYANRYGHDLVRLAARLQQLVTERTAQLTAANQELGAKARALEVKQEELKAFVHTVTHDLKNPLNAVLLITDMLRQREGHRLTAEGLAELERVTRLAEGTEDMLRDLLGLFRITTAPEGAGWVNLDALVAHALEALEPQISAKGVHVRVEQLPRVWGQRDKLAHVVANLLGNAVKYVSSGRGEVRVSGALVNGHALLAVADNGIGIPPEYQQRIFELFRRVPDDEQRVDGRVVGGSGVGLAMVRRIVEGHGGTVEVDSTPGGGSRFAVRLPAGGSGGLA